MPAPRSPSPASSLVDQAARLIEADPARGVELAEEAITLAGSSGEPDNAIEGWRLIGFTRIAAADYAGALELFMDAEEDLAVRFGIGETPAEFLDGIGVAYQHLGLYVTAYSYLEEARRKLRPGTRPRSRISLLNNLGLVLWQLGERDRGIAILQDALDACSEAEIERVTWLGIRANLAELLGSGGRTAEAEAELRAILASCDGPELEPTRGQALDGLASTLKEQGRLADALAAIEESMAIFRGLGAERDLVESRRCHAEILLAMGRASEAVASCDTGLGLPGAASPSVRAELLAVKARAFEDLEDFRSACMAWRDYRAIDPRGEISRSRAEIMESSLGAQRVAAAELQSQLRAKAEAMTRAQETIIEALAGIAEARDDITGKHIRRAARYVAVLMAEYANRCPACISREQLELYAATAPLHDIGKVGIPDSILQKPGPLDAAERAAVEEHPLLGERVLTRASWDSVDKSYADAAMEIVGAHHERWDGKGYPRGLAGGSIPLGGRIMAVADVYDAMRSARPYKGPLSHGEAVAFISSEAGRRFDPLIVESFLSVAAEFDRIFDSD